MNATGQRRGGRRNRIEQEAQRRRVRAHSHLDRVRNKKTTPTASATRPLFVLGAAVLATGFGFWSGGDAAASWGSGAWRLESVEVLGAKRLSAVEVARAAGMTPGTGYDAAAPDRVARALGEHAWVAEAHAARLPGGTVVLSVREREPLAVIEARSGPLGVDAEGRPFAVLDSREAGDLPRLRCDNAPPPGEPDERLAEAIRVARSLPERGLALPREIELKGERDPEGLVLRLPGLEARFVLGAENLDERVAAMAELLAKRPAEVAEAVQVDLRFAGQAVLRGKDDPKGSA
jgi:cell division protein FtsQ